MKFTPALAAVAFCHSTLATPQYHNPYSSDLDARDIDPLDDLESDYLLSVRSLFADEEDDYSDSLYTRSLDYDNDLYEVLSMLSRRSPADEGPGTFWSSSFSTSSTGGHSGPASNADANHPQDTDQQTRGSHQTAAPPSSGPAKAPALKIPTNGAPGTFFSPETSPGKASPDASVRALHSEAVTPGGLRTSWDGASSDASMHVLHSNGGTPASKTPPGLGTGLYGDSTPSPPSARPQQGRLPTGSKVAPASGAPQGPKCFKKDGSRCTIQRRWLEAMDWDYDFAYQE